MLERQASDKPKMQVQRAQRQQQQVAAPVSNIQELQEPRADRIVRALSQFGKASTDLYVQEKQKEIEIEKAEQVKRAYSDVDAQFTGQYKQSERAFRIAKMGNEIDSISNQYSEFVSKYPDATEEDKKKERHRLQNEFLSEFQDDPQLLKAAGTLMQERQSELNTMEFSAKRQYQQQENLNQFQQYIVKEAEGLTPEELAASISDSGELYKYGRDLGILPEQQRALLEDAAIQQAMTGDNSLIEAIKKTGWGGASAKTAKAQSVYEEYLNKRAFFERGDAKADTTREWQTGEVSWGEVERQIKAQNRKWPNTWTVEQVAALKNSMYGRKGSEWDSSEVFASRGKGMPIGARRDYTSSQLATAYQNEQENFAMFLNGEIANGKRQVPEGFEQEDYVAIQWLDYISKFANEELLDFPQIRRKLEAVPHFDIDPEATELPPWAQEFVTVMHNMKGSPDYLGVDNKSRAMYQNLMYFQEQYGMSEAEAWRRARTAVYEPRDVDPDARKIARDKATLITKRTLDTSWFQRVFGSAYATQAEDMREFSREVEQDAILLYQSGALDMDASIREAANRRKGEVTQISNGQLLKSRPEELIMEMMLGKTAIDPRTNQEVLVKPDFDATTYLPEIFEAVFEDQKSEILKRTSKKNLKFTDVRVDIHPDLKVVKFVDSKTGQELTSPVNLADFGRSARKIMHKRKVKKSKGKWDYNRDATFPAY